MAKDRFEIFVPLTKVDIQTRQVYGRATQEIPDAVREVMDYQTSMPNFKKWSEITKARSGKAGEGSESLGNLRAMHQPIAAGKLIDMQFNHADKAVDIGVFVSDDDSWNKVLTGTYTGFSVGGSYGKRWRDMSNSSLIRYTAVPTEISLVDSPAVPTATFTLVKLDGSRELHKAGQPIDLPAPLDENPANPIPFIGADTNPNAPPIDKVTLGQDVNSIPAAANFLNPDLIDSNRAVVPGATPRSDPVAKTDAPEWVADAVSTVNELVGLLKVEAEKRAKAEQKLAAIGSRVGIARREGEPMAASTGLPTDHDAYGDPANYAFPYEKREQLITAISRFNGRIGKASYSDREWNVLGRRIAAQAAKTSGAGQYDPALKKIKDHRMLDLAKIDVMPLLAQVQQALNVAADQIGNDPTALRDLLLNLVGNLDGAAQVQPASPGSSSPSAPTGSQLNADKTVLKGTLSPVTGSSVPLDGGGTTRTTTTVTPPPGSGPTTPMPNVPALSSSADDMTGKAVFPGGDSSASSSSSSSSSSDSSASSTPSTAPSGTTPKTLAAVLPSASATPPTLGISGGQSGATSTGTPSAPSTPLDAYKAIEQKLDTLGTVVKGLVDYLSGPGAQIKKNTLPAGDLQQLFKNAEMSQVDPVMNTLLSGDPRALAKAAIVAGGTNGPDLEQVQDMAHRLAVETLEKSGVFSEFYNRSPLTYSPAPNDPPQQ